MMYSRYIRHDIPVELFTVLMFVGFLRFLDDRGSRWVVLALAAAAGAITSAEMSYINGFVLVTFILLALLVESLPSDRARRIFAGVLTALGVTVLFVAELAMGGGVDTPWVKELDLVAGLCLTWALGAALLTGVRGRPGVFAQLRRVRLDGLLSGLAVFAVIYLLMFTTFFQNPEGWKGFWNSITYWLAQHGVERGSQPWYYYLLFTPMYEYLVMLPAVAAVLYYFLRPGLRFARGNEAPADEPPSPAAWAYVPMTASWALGVFWIYSWAGEKMPWLIVHLVVPMAFLAGRLVADLAGRADVAAWRSRAWQFALLSAVGLYLLLAALAGWGAGGAGANVQLVAGLVVGIALLLAAAAISRGMRGQIRLALAAGFALLLLGLNVRDSLRANFVNDELANEYIVYAHGTPDDKDVYEQLLEMQELKGEADPLTVGYDNEVSWPFTWYFRHTDWFESPYYFAEKPQSVSKLKEQDAVLVGSPNYAEFEPWLREDYVEIEYQRMWWPNEGYKGLTLGRLRETLTDRNQLANIIGILSRREYRLNPSDPNSPLKSLDDWYHQANMKLFVRKDTIEELWPVAEARPDWLRQLDTTVVERLYPRLELEAEQVYPGTPDEALAQPKGVAVAESGEVWVLDHANKRVVGFNPDGTGGEILAEGELEYPDQNSDQRWPSAWGIEVGPDGAVYVADTWNHRVVRYQNGRESGSFGRGLAPPEDPLSMETIDSLFGPRDVAVREDGHVFFTDTGNKRIIELDANLEPVRAIGGHGTDPGQFNEPTSLAFDTESGELYVADLWNLRIQVFDRDLEPVRSWPVDGWGSEEAAHKAYLDVYPGGTVAVSDPVGARIWLFDREGETLGTLELTTDPDGLMEPIGVSFDGQGRLYVASSANNRITRFSAPAAIAGGDPADDEAADDTDDADMQDEDAANEDDGAALDDGEASSEDEAAADEGQDAAPEAAEGEDEDAAAERSEDDADTGAAPAAPSAAQMALAAFLDGLDPEISQVVAEAIAAGEDAEAAAIEAGLDARRASRLAELLAAVEAEASAGEAGAEDAP
jgi:uncharacterized protein (TIGR03663 family)